MTKRLSFDELHEILHDQNLYLSRSMAMLICLWFGFCTENVSRSFEELMRKAYLGGIEWHHQSEATRRRLRTQT